MRTIITLLSTAVLALNAISSGCVAWPGAKDDVPTTADHHVKGQGEVVKRTLTVPAFHGIVLEGSMDVELTPSGTRSVVVEAQANIAELVTAEVKDGICHINTKGDGFSTDRTLTVHISLPMIDFVSIEGSGDVKGTGLFTMDDLKLSTNGSGDMTLEVAAKKLAASIEGSGDMKLSGSCDQVKVSVQGSGDVNARGLKSSSAQVAIAGSGDVTVNTSMELTASVEGSGNVLYEGDPKNVSKDISGSGEIRSLQRPKSGKL